MNIVLIIICLLSQFGYIYFSNQKKYIPGVILKTLASLIFVLFAYQSYVINKIAVNKLFLFGFIFDFIGDVFLALRNLLAHDFMFIFGTLIFIVGHIFYIVSLISNISNYMFMFIGILVGMGLFLLINKISKISIPFKVVGMIYCPIIYMMFFMALGMYIDTTNLKSLLMVLGLGLFACSDTILVFYNFYKKANWMHPTYLSIYYVAQIVLAFSLRIMCL